LASFPHAAEIPVHQIGPHLRLQHAVGQFIDDDGTPYLIFEDRPYGFRVEKEVCLIRMI
jgi:hypothetical protein